MSLTHAAGLSSRLKFGPFVTNPITRHAAVTAAAAATLQELTKGRIVLGLGRGDSSLAYLGYGPMKLKPFEAYLNRLQTYLHGAEVPFETSGYADALQVATLGYGKTPDASRIMWLPAAQPKVPVDVAAAGPKVMSLAAQVADAVTFGIGTDPARIRWAMTIARDACRAVGRNPDAFHMGALVSVFPHPDAAVARRVAAGSAASIARWTVFQGAGRGNLDAETYAALEGTVSAYDMTKHGMAGTSHARAIGDNVIEKYAIAGTPDYCVARLQELMVLGLNRITVPLRGRGTDPEAQSVATRLMREQVLPKLR